MHEFTCRSPSKSAEIRLYVTSFFTFVSRLQQGIFNPAIALILLVIGGYLVKFFLEGTLFDFLGEFDKLAAVAILAAVILFALFFILRITAPAPAYVLGENSLVLTSRKTGGKLELPYKAIKTVELKKFEENKEQVYEVIKNEWGLYANRKKSMLDMYNPLAFSNANKIVDGSMLSFSGIGFSHDEQQYVFIKAVNERSTEIDDPFFALNILVLSPENPEEFYGELKKKTA